MDNPPLHRKPSSGSSVGVNFRCFCFYNYLFVLSIVTIVAAANNVSSSNNQRDLSSTLGTEACAGCTLERCVSTTVASSLCNPCANGQQWWPCNLPGECYCSDGSTLTRTGTETAVEACSTAACTSRGGKCVSSSPNVNDDHCAPCADGGQSWWPCNIVGGCSCEILTEEPTKAPTVPPISSSSNTDNTDNGTNQANQENETNQPTLAPTQQPKETRNLEGMLVLNAHITANKLVLARELLLSPSMNGANANTFSYMGFIESLKQMILTPIMIEAKDPKTNEDIEVPLVFYIGDMTTESTRPKSNNERAYGLVNVALFLATSYFDSLSNGSCDEINSDIVNGFLPISNACGQNYMSYQGTVTDSDLRQGDSESLVCAPGDEKYACTVDLNMRASARSHASGPDAPGPFYCGPKTDYNGFTGHWSFEDNEEIFQSAKQNKLGRTDVQGCCFWGRGSVPIRGTCAYGKLNYYLGKRAADEGRSAMFPDIDFCRNPGAICSDEHPDLKWIVGLFRWITEIQEYDYNGFNYMKQLRKYVDNGFKDWNFLDSVSGIVSQGCHKPPCRVGAQFLREEKRANFAKILKILGLHITLN